MKKYFIILICVIVCFAAGCGGTGLIPSYNIEPESEGTLAPDVTPEPQEDIPAPDIITGTIEMENGGIITFELYEKIAPQSVRNFVELARAGYYDGLKFHRIMTGFMIQGGCPNGVGNGHPGYSIFGEFAANGFENNLFHSRGVISMARGSTPNSAGSQFFICHADREHLNGNYAAFGMVTSGMEVVDEIAETPVLDNNGKVAAENMPVIKSITIDGNFTLEGPDKFPR